MSDHDTHSPPPKTKFSEVLLTIGDITRPIADWCAMREVSTATVRARYIRGERDPERLLFKPQHKKSETGDWEYHASLEAKPQPVTTAFLLNLFPHETQNKLRRVAQDMNMPLDEVLITLVEHSLKRINI